ncbi:MAG: rod shape-determining protein MreD [bacterium]|nr:rod shape-determining protein MreD [bacterium]
MRALLALSLLVVAGAVQTILAHRLARIGLPLDLLLVCAVCCAMTAGEGATVGVAACAGLFRDAFSAGPFGHSAAVFIPVALLVHWTRRALGVTHGTTRALLAAGATIVAALLAGLFSRLRGEAPAPWIGSAWAGALVNAAVAPPLFRVWRAVMR